MNIVIFIFYLLVFCVLISAIPFFKNSGIGKNLLPTLFIAKVGAGIAYARFYTLPKYYPGSDTWRFYRLSLDETRLLSASPRLFIKDLFYYGYNSQGNLFSGKNSYWNDLKSNLIIKIMALINVLTNSSYYTNIIFFNFLFLFGLVALFKLFYKEFPEKKYFIIAGIFLLPSTLFWCSGIHKDGLILSATGLIVYAFNEITEKGFSLKKAVVIVLCTALVFALRNYVVFALLPGVFAWGICKNIPCKNALIFASVYLAGIVVFFGLPAFFPGINFPLFLVEKQQEFLLLKGESEVIVPQLKPGLLSFISFLPNAIDMAFFRPHINEIKHFAYIPAIVETIILWGIFIICLFSIHTKRKTNPALMFLVFFSLSIMFLSGYTIPFTGAIVRYRSFVLPMLFTPLLCFANFNIPKIKKNWKNIIS